MKFLYFFIIFFCFELLTMEPTTITLIDNHNNKVYTLTNCNHIAHITNCIRTTCDLCPGLIGKNDNILSINEISYHRSCWRAVSLDLFYTSKSSYVPFSSFAKIINLLLLPASLYIGLKDYRQVASCLGLVGTGLTAWYAHYFLINKNHIPKTFTSEEWDIEEERQLFPKVIRDSCSCLQCSNVLSFPERLRTIVNKNGVCEVYHEHCAKRLANISEDFYRRYSNAVTRDFFSQWIPTPLHAINYIAGSYLLYAASKVLLQKAVAKK